MQNKDQLVNNQAVTLQSYQDTTKSFEAAIKSLNTKWRKLGANPRQEELLSLLSSPLEGISDYSFLMMIAASAYPSVSITHEEMQNSTILNAYLENNRHIQKQLKIANEILSKLLDAIPTCLDEPEINSLLSKKTKDGWTVLHLAASYNPQLLGKLLRLLTPKLPSDRIAKHLKDTDRHHQSVLHHLMMCDKQAQDDSVVKELFDMIATFSLEDRKDILSSKDHSGHSPFSLAIVFSPRLTSLFYEPINQLGEEYKQSIYQQRDREQNSLFMLATRFAINALPELIAFYSRNLSHEQAEKDIVSMCKKKNKEGLTPLTMTAKYQHRKGFHVLLQLISSLSYSAQKKIYGNEGPLAYAETFLYEKLELVPLRYPFCQLVGQPGFNKKDRDLYKALLKAQCQFLVSHLNAAHGELLKKEGNNYTAKKLEIIINAFSHIDKAKLLIAKDKLISPPGFLERRRLSTSFYKSDISTILAALNEIALKLEGFYLEEMKESTLVIANKANAS